MDDNQYKMSTLDQRANQLASMLLRFRQMQNQATAAFLDSLGNLNMQELNVLNCIGDRENSIMSDIAKQVSLSLSSISVIVDKLVKLNLVNRIRSEEDRRIVYASLTPEGKKIYQIQIDHLNELLKYSLEQLAEEEQKKLIQIIQKLTGTFV